MKKNIKKIEKLNLSNTNVDDISFLQNNKNIIYLDLSQLKNIKDYSYIKNCEKLNILVANRSNIKDISFLEKTKKIKKLFLNGCKSIKYFSYIKY